MYKAIFPLPLMRPLFLWSSSIKFDLCYDVFEWSIMETRCLLLFFEIFGFFLHISTYMYYNFMQFLYFLCKMLIWCIELSLKKNLCYICRCNAEKDLTNVILHYKIVLNNVHSVETLLIKFMKNGFSFGESRYLALVLFHL